MESPEDKKLRILVESLCALTGTSRSKQPEEAFWKSFAKIMASLMRALGIPPEEGVHMCVHACGIMSLAQIEKIENLKEKKEFVEFFKRSATGALEEYGALSSRSIKSNFAWEC
jgi:hypothetical protein